MIIAVQIFQCPLTKIDISINKRATFEFRQEAQDWAEDKEEVMLIDCDTGVILKNAHIKIEEDNDPTGQNNK